MENKREKTNLLKIANNHGFDEKEICYDNYNVQLVRMIPYLKKHNNQKEIANNFYVDTGWNICELTDESIKTLNDYIKELKQKYGR